jgi:hypothetical protein
MPAPDPKHEERRQTERRRQVRGLLLLAAAVLLFSLLRAGSRSVFTHGWWRIW